MRSCSTAKASIHRAWRRQSGFAISTDGARAAVEPARLRAIPVFERLDDAELELLANRFVTERYAAGETVFDENDEGDKLHIIVRGTVEVIRRGEDGRTMPIAVLQDGDFFGEIALLEEAAASRRRELAALG